MHEDDEDDEPTGKQPQNNEGYMTQQEVADVLGLSRHTVNKVEQKALRKFKYFDKNKNPFSQNKKSLFSCKISSIFVLMKSILNFM